MTEYVIDIDLFIEAKDEATAHKLVAKIEAALVALPFSVAAELGPLEEA